MVDAKMRSTYRFQFFALCLIWLCITKTNSLQPATLSYSVIPQDQCVLIVQLNCTIHSLTSLNWFFDDQQISTYTYSDGSRFPSVVHDNSGVRITITSATPYAQMSDHFDGTSTLTTNTSVLNRRMVDSIQCGTNSIRSQRISRGMLEFTVLSPPPNVSSCVLISHPGAVAIYLSWSPSFTYQHGVERYRMSVSPDPSSCSSGQVSPSEDYNCSGLVLGEIYQFTVSAINCDGREGHARTFSAALNGPVPPSIVNVSALYTGNSLSYNLEEIQATLQYGETDDVVVIQGGVQCVVNVTRTWESTLISFEGSSGDRLLKEFTANSRSCDKLGSVCSAQILVSPVTGDSYSLSSSAVHITGYVSPFQHYSHYLNGSFQNLFNYTLTKSGDAIFALCSVHLENVVNCSIQYTQDHHYKNLSLSVTGPNNTPFLVTAIDTETETIFYHQASIMIAPSLQIIVRANDVLLIQNQSLADESVTASIDENFTVSLEIYQLGLFGTLFFLLFFSLIICLIAIVFLCRKGKRAPLESLHEYSLPHPHESTAAEQEARKYVDVDYNVAESEEKASEVVYEEIANNKTAGFRPERNSVQLMTYNHAYHTAKFDL